MLHTTECQTTRIGGRGCLPPLSVPESRGRRRWLPAWLTLSAALLALGGCNDNNNYCRNCGYVPPSDTPQEVSFGLVSGNFNNNGHTSVIATSTIIYNPQANAGYLKIYLSTGSGAFAAPVLTSDGSDPLYLASADLNGDKLPDVVSASYRRRAVWRYFSTTPKARELSPRPSLLPSPGASQVAIGDMNGDGLPDLVSADFNVSLFLQTSPGAFASPVSLYPGGANWVARGRPQWRRIPDVALTDNVGVKVLMHTGAASATTYAAPVSVFTQTPNSDVAGANLIAIADVNGDGFNDLVITDPGPTGGAAPTVSVLLQDADSPGQFLAPVSYPTAPAAVRRNPSS